MIAKECSNFPFCSKHCSEAKEKPIKECVTCKVEFKTTHPNAKFCSRKCKTVQIKSPYNGFINGVDTSTTGAIAELMACVDLMKKGYEVFRAMSPSSHCDILGIKDGVVHLYEVRTGTYIESKNGKRLTWINRKAHGKEMIVVTYKDHKVHYIPSDVYTTPTCSSVFVLDDGSIKSAIPNTKQLK